jgi:hypothetical protein
MEDDLGDYGIISNIVDTKANVERQAIMNITSHKNTRYPHSSGEFCIKRLVDDSSLVKIHNGSITIEWKSPPGPCVDERHSHSLCDGLVPSCEPYRGVTQQDSLRGFSPTGCKAFRSCSHSWSRKIYSRRLPNDPKNNRSKPAGGGIR